MDTQLKFKFKFLDDEGNEAGFLSKKGSLDGESLTLDGKAIPLVALLKTLRRFNRLILSLATEEGEAAVAIVVTKGNIKKLHLTLNEISSERRARAYLEHLESQGKADRFRVEACPHCNSTLTLPGVDPTPQMYCEYCDTVYTIDGSGPSDEKRFALCDETQLYSQPREFTIFYFYFLLFIYGWRYRKVHLCNAAMKPHAWKMLFCNLPFIIGVPVAIAQLIRVYRGGEASSKDFAGLNTANTLAIKGRFDEASQRYLDIAERMPAAAGLRYNLGLVCLRDNRVADAALAFEDALRDCGNYQPAAGGLGHCLKTLGRHEELARLEAQWGNDDEAVNGQADGEGEGSAEV